jgi:hypothetical protein
MKLLKTQYLLGILIAVMILTNLLWLLTDRTPPAWDQAAHIRSVVLANNFINGQTNFVDLVRSFGGYPPLIYLVGGVWTSLFGVSIFSVSFLNTLFLVAGIVGVYKLSGNKILPAVLFSLFPVIYDISRNFLLDLPLLVFVVWGLYFWIKNNDVGILVMLVLASLTKLNGFLYFGPIGLWYLWEARKSEKIFLRLVAGGLIYLVAVGWWWGINWQNIYQYLTGLAGTGEKLTDPMNLASLTTWIHYFRLFFLHQASPVLAMVTAISWFYVPKDKHNKMLVYWAIFVYVIFTIIKNKDFRFTMPLLPVMAVWIGGYLIQIKNKLYIYILFIYLVFQFVENSFGWPIQKPVLGVTPTFLMGDVEWIGWDDYPVRAPNGNVWPQKEIINDLEKLKIDTGKKSRILVLINKEEINDNNLGMYKELYSSRAFEVGSVGSRARFVSDEEITTLLKEFDGVLVAEKSQEPAPFYGVNLEAYVQARDWVIDHPENFQLVSQYKIFGDKDLFLFRNTLIN